MKTKVKASDYVNKNVSPDSDDYFDFANFTKDLMIEQGYEKELKEEIGEEKIRSLSEQRQQYLNTYTKGHYKRVTVLIPKEKEEILAFLKTKKPVSTYILELIQNDMEKNGNK